MVYNQVRTVKGKTTSLISREVEGGDRGKVRLIKFKRIIKCKSFYRTKHKTTQGHKATRKDQKCRHIIAPKNDLRQLLTRITKRKSFNDTKHKNIKRLENTKVPTHDCF